MKKREYDYKIDKAICKSLVKYENANISRRKLKQIIESRNHLGRKLGTRLYEFHVHRLLDEGYLFEKKEKWTRGKKLPLFLSNRTREQLRLGNLKIEFKEKYSRLLNSYKKLKKRHKLIEDRFKNEDKRNWIYYIIMCVLSIETPNKHYRHPCLSIDDILNARYNGHAFYYLRLEDDKRLVEECLCKLEKENIVKKIKIRSEDEPRYELVDLRWKSFVIECSEFLEDTVMMELHLKWANLRRPRPQERIYYELCRGDRNANGHLILVVQNFDGNEKKSSARYKQKIEDLLYSIDCNLYQKFINFESKYGDLADECSSIYSMIVETVYPKFLREEIERIVNNPKNRGRKYYRLQSSQFNDSLAFSDSVQSMTCKLDK